MKKTILFALFALFSLPVALKAQVQLSIDFETNNSIPDVFTNESAYPWIIENTENGHCMKSGNPGSASSSSSIELSYTFTQAGYIMFDAKCCGEGTSTAYDKCIFYIDNVMQFEYGAQIIGWQNYVFFLEAGAHTFMWKYTKDSSVDPTGDAFFVDNIFIGYGTPCIQPYNLTVNATTNSAVVNWSGSSDSYSIHYKPLNASEWDTIPNISGNSDTIYNLTEGDYAIMVSADCNDEEGVLDTFSVFSVNSVNWYGYATYSLDNQSWNYEYIRFTMQDPTTVTAVTSYFPNTYAAALAYGHVWFISEENLYIAPLNDSIGAIGDGIPVVFDFETTSTPISMSFNPMDNKLYYIAVSSDSYYLKCFNPLQPDSVSTLELSISALTLAINAQGEAYCIEYGTGNLYLLDLTNASSNLVGNTGHSAYFVQDMAFDMETNELYWAQISSTSDVGLYHVNTETAATTFLGQIGGGNGAEITGLFCSNSFSPIPVIPNSLNLSGDTIICSGNTTSLTASSDVDGLFIWSTGHIGQWETFSGGTYSVTVFSNTGYSLTKTFNITENQVYEVTDNLSICENQLPYIWNEVEFETSGTQNVTLTTINGCDSVVTMHLTIFNPVHTTVTETACERFTWNGTTYTQSGDYPLTFSSANGCDSIVTLHLTINNPVDTTITETACESYTWNDSVFTQSGDYTQTFTAANGCDSAVTLHLTLYENETSEFSITTSDSCYIWNNIEYCTSGDYTQTLQTIHGCDSIVTLHLTITVGIDDYETVDFKVFPNPTNGIVNVEYTMKNDEWGEVEIQVVDMYGKLVDVVETVHAPSLQTAKIDLSQYANGVYFVKWIADGKTIAVRKVVKQ